MTFTSASAARAVLIAARAQNAPNAASMASSTARRWALAPRASAAAGAAATAGAPRRRAISSAPSVTDPKTTSKVPQGNDSIWAISSVIVFGSLFFYLTSPKSKSGHGHGAHGSHGDHKQSSSTKPVVSPEEAEESDGESGVDFVVVEQPVLNVKTAGGEALKERLIDDHTKQVSANNRAPPVPNKGETFKHGVAASKDGNLESNPKAVVAAAHEEKQQKYGKSSSTGAAPGKGTKDEGDAAETKDE